jgi:hypothetical protein
MNSRILFICKKREHISEPYSHGGKSSGLFNSIRFVVDMLTENFVECKMVEVIDNNGIDSEVFLFKPTHVIIEALWVVPEKFNILTKLHPKVKWYIRLHSEIPFIANEGITFDWINNYTKYNNVFIAVNSDRIHNDLKSLYHKPILYLPNFYPIHKIQHQNLKDTDPENIDIGCFGAIRPLKNHLIQAVSAIRFADKIQKSLKFHINGNRIEGKGEPVLRNLRGLFANKPEHKLIEHDWMPHDTFINLLKTMDLTMQVSFTETYNIVAADAIAAGTPIVCSKEIKFVCPIFYADPTDTENIIKKIHLAYYTNINKINYLNRFGLEKDAKLAKRKWLSFALPQH